MSVDSESKSTATAHVEDTQRQAQLAEVITQRQYEDAEKLQEKYHIPLKAVLEGQLEEDPQAVRKVMRKVDWRLVPMLSLLYMWAFIDRANLGNVRHLLSQPCYDIAQSCWSTDHVHRRILPV